MKYTPDITFNHESDCDFYFLDSNVMNAIQQVQLQLNSLETEGQRHSAKIQDILRATTRLESQRQEFIGILDRSESHISQRLEDVKGDVRKVLVFPELNDFCII
ncbi:hypothetical protein AVEN_93025-1 [Araneus ventricosus]|uniref:Uncharacterized protein n=1 Tax=Araneus ventricosus TaxID=182803 RepID=A0A4Y2RQ26_ARAVE|nr:hypothetical protein AVEN_73508-1 [Araneus ventricosus]GBN77761.1 hypothetical protein AVEN_93025-1 [Araneus ventricosus]